MNLMSQTHQHCHTEKFPVSSSSSARRASVRRDVEKFLTWKEFNCNHCADEAQRRQHDDGVRQASNLDNWVSEFFSIFWWWVLYWLLWARIWCECFKVLVCVHFQLDSLLLLNTEYKNWIPNTQSSGIVSESFGPEKKTSSERRHIYAEPFTESRGIISFLIKTVIFSVWIRNTDWDHGGMRRALTHAQLDIPRRIGAMMMNRRENLKIVKLIDLYCESSTNDSRAVAAWVWMREHWKRLLRLLNEWVIHLEFSSASLYRDSPPPLTPSVSSSRSSDSSSLHLCYRYIT